MVQFSRISFFSNKNLDIMLVEIQLRNLKKINALHCKKNKCLTLRGIVIKHISHSSVLGANRESCNNLIQQ